MDNVNINAGVAALILAAILISVYKYFRGREKISIFKAVLLTLLLWISSALSTLILAPLVLSETISASLLSFISSISIWIIFIYLLNLGRIIFSELQYVGAKSVYFYIIFSGLGVGLIYKISYPHVADYFQITDLIAWHSLYESSVLYYVSGLVIAPVGEELFFRGYLLRNLNRRYSSFLALLLSTLLFIAFHANPGQIYIGLLIGIISGLIYIRSESIKLSILFHIIVNAYIVLIHPALQSYFSGKVKLVVITLAFFVFLFSSYKIFFLANNKGK